MHVEPPFSIEIENSVDTLLVIVRGELVLDTAPQLRLALQAAPSDRTVRLDLSGVSFMDSTGVGAVVRGYAAMQETGGRLLLRTPLGAAAEHALGLAGVLEHLPLDGR